MTTDRRTFVVANADPGEVAVRQADVMGDVVTLAALVTDAPAREAPVDLPGRGSVV
jgi:hypothetical protein